MSLPDIAAFTDLFIAISVAAVVSYRFGWRSAALGVLAGTGITLLVAPLLDPGAAGMVTHWLSALLLLAFGIHLQHAFLGGLDLRDAGSPVPTVSAVGWDHRASLPGLVLAAWASVAQGLAVLGTWQSVALHNDATLGGGAAPVSMAPVSMAPASMTVALSIGILGLMAWAFSGTGILRRMPAYVADGLSAFLITAYGACFLAFAFIAT